MREVTCLAQQTTHCTATSVSAEYAVRLDYLDIVGG